jgi:hypothetical protein
MAMNDGTKLTNHGNRYIMTFSYGAGKPEKWSRHTDKIRSFAHIARFLEIVWALESQFGPAK